MYNITTKNFYCFKCDTEFNSSDYIYDESGTGYYTKLIKCPRCGRKIIVKNIEDYATKMMGDVGMDPRYYEY